MEPSSTCPLPSQSRCLAQPDRSAHSFPSVRPRNATLSPVTRQGRQKKQEETPPPQNLKKINRLDTSPSHRGEGVSGSGVAACARRAPRAPAPGPRIQYGGRLSGPPLSQGAHDTTVLRKQGQEPPHPLLGGGDLLRPSPRIPGLNETVVYSVPEGAGKRSPSFIRSAGFQPAWRPGWPPSQAENPSTFTRNQQSPTRCSASFLFGSEAAVVEAVVRTGDVACPIP